MNVHDLRAPLYEQAATTAPDPPELPPMQSNDARMLWSAAIPTALAGAVAAAVSAAVAGGRGAVGAVVGVTVVIVFFGAGLIALQKAAQALPHLFQAMGLLVYTTQLLALVIALAVFRNTGFFNLRTFAFTLLGTTVVWVIAQIRGHMKAKILYVEPQPDEAREDAVQEHGA